MSPADPSAAEQRILGQLGPGGAGEEGPGPARGEPSGDQLADSGDLVAGNLAAGGLAAGDPAQVPCPASLLITLPRVLHVGTLRAADQGQGAAKGGVSFEGHHLSVSSCPDAWRQIAGCSGPTWSLSRPGALFLDLHRARRHRGFLDALHRWGRRAGLAAPVTYWACRLPDADGDVRSALYRTAGGAFEVLVDALYDQDLVERLAAETQADLEATERWLGKPRQDGDVQGGLSRFTAKLAAELEGAGGLAGGPLALVDALKTGPVRAVMVAIGTPALAEATGMPLDGHEADDALAVLWAERYGQAAARAAGRGGQVSGVWWRDRRDPARYVAPRGLIFRNQVAQWTAERAEGQAE